jgi:sulfatase maturation enzyme AslB (radical SAM superfamily)
MIISVNPTYYCNFRCDFCYLTPQQLSDRGLLSLDTLSNRLTEIMSHTSVDMVDIYGGEAGLLSDTYWNNLISTLYSYGIDDINLITNLSMLNSITQDDRIHTSVSYDFEARESSDKVWRNMVLLNKPFSVLMLASPELIKQDVDYMINMFNTLSNLISVEIKPYSANQANQLQVSYSDYEQFVKKWIVNKNKKFQLNNTYLIETVLDGSRNSFSDDHVYITPAGNYSVLEFDLNGNEFFKEYKTFDEYLNWCKLEKARVSKNEFCSKCDYYGKCLSEHLREVKNLDNSCNGFVNLIEWYKNEQ